MKRRYYIALGIIVLIVVLLVGNRFVMKAGLEREIERMRAAGYPTSIEELHTKYPIPPPEENAATVLRQAFAAFADEDIDFNYIPISGPGAVPEPDESWDPEVWEEMAKFLEANAEALDLIHEAVQLPDSRFVEDPVAAIADPESSEHFASLRMAARRLAIKASFEAELGHSAGTAQSLVDIILLSNLVSRDPDLLHSLVASAIRGIGMANLEWLINRGKLDSASLAKVGRALEESEQSIDPERMISGEHIAWLEYLRESRKTTPLSADFPDVPGAEALNFMPGWIRGGTRATVRGLGFYDHEDYIFLKTLRRYLRATRRSSTEATKSILEWENSSFDDPMLQFMPQTEMSFWFDGEGALDAIWLHPLADLRTARVGTAVARYRIEQGEVPESLDALVPEYLDAIPENPYTGEPLNYQLLPGHAVVYAADPQDPYTAPYSPQNDRKVRSQAPFVLMRSAD